MTSSIFVIFVLLLILYSFFKDTVGAIENLKDVWTKNYANLTMIVGRMANVHFNAYHYQGAVLNNVNAIKNLKYVRTKNYANLTMIVERMANVIGDVL